MKKIAFIILLSLLVLSSCRNSSEELDRGFSPPIEEPPTIILSQAVTIYNEYPEIDYLQPYKVNREDWIISICSECGKKYYHYKDVYMTKCEPCTPLEEKVK